MVKVLFLNLMLRVTINGGERPTWWGTIVELNKKTSCYNLGFTFNFCLWFFFKITLGFDLINSKCCSHWCNALFCLCFYSWHCSMWCPMFSSPLFMFLLMTLFAMMTFCPPLLVLFLVMLNVKNRNTNERKKNTYIPIWHFY